MHPAWPDFLRLQGIASGDAEPGRMRAELQAAAEGCAIGPLTGYDWIEVSGSDAESFLHAQLSSDVHALAPDRCQLSTYNSPKGRVLATLLAWRTAEGFLLQVPAVLAAALCKRLALYVLRSKVRISVAAERCLGITLAGPHAAQVLSLAGLPVPESFGLVAADEALSSATQVLCLPGARFELLCADVATAFGLWQGLCAQGAAPGGADAWHWRTVASGIAEIVPQTQDQYVVQMLNYELLGAVSFNKGCYPGQEIVARTQYRGGTKRRTLLFHTSGAAVPQPAQRVQAPGGETVGEVLTAANAPCGGYDLLACVHLDLARGRELRLEGGTAALERLALPYAVPEAA